MLFNVSLCINVWVTVVESSISYIYILVFQSGWNSISLLRKWQNKQNFLNYYVAFICHLPNLLSDFLNCYVFLIFYEVLFSLSLLNTLSFNFRELQYHSWCSFLVNKIYIKTNSCVICKCLFEKAKFKNFSIFSISEVKVAESSFSIGVEFWPVLINIFQVMSDIKIQYHLVLNTSCGLK